MKEKESTHKLTKAEQRRLDNFNKIREDLEGRGYKSTELLISLSWANIFAVILLFPVLIVSIILLYLLHPDAQIFFSLFGNGPLRMIGMLIVFLVLIVVHELIHGFFWGLFAENHFKDIEFGFIAKTCTPYCTCKTALPKGKYILGTLMPLILLGIIPTVIGIVIGSFAVVIIGSIMIDSAAGDILIIHKILSHRTSAREVLYYDHPTEAGGIIFEKE